MMDSARILLSSAFLIAATTLHSQSFEALQYRTVGPGRGGRVTSVAGTPIAPSTFYLGASGGGLWKTEDYGTSWHNVSDGFFASPSAMHLSQMTSAEYLKLLMVENHGRRCCSFPTKLALPI